MLIARRMRAAYWGLLEVPQSANEPRKSMRGNGERRQEDAARHEARHWNYLGRGGREGGREGPTSQEQVRGGLPATERSTSFGAEASMRSPTLVL